MELRSGLSRVTDRATWQARRASFMAKLKATKTVWFPPQSGGAASTAKKTTKKAAKKTTRTAKRTTNATKAS